MEKVLWGLLKKLSRIYSRFVMSLKSQNFTSPAFHKAPVARPDEPWHTNAAICFNYIKCRTYRRWKKTNTWSSILMKDCTLSNDFHFALSQLVCLLLLRPLMRSWDEFPKLPRRRCWQRWTRAPEPSAPGLRPPSSVGSRSSCAISNSSKITL